MTTLDTILERIRYLTPFPHTMMKLLTLLENPDITTEIIVTALRNDQAIVSNVLRLCNSSYYGARKTITNLRYAISYIGFVELRKIILISGSKHYYKEQRAGYELHKGELWKHSLATSIISEKINTIVPCSTPDELFIAALLHDIGKLVLSEFVVEDFQRIMVSVEQGDTPFLDAERTVIGIDHAEVGSRVLSLWNFPEPVTKAVRKHHSPLHADDSAVDNIVRLSDTLAMMMGYGTSVDGLAYHSFADICRLYDIKHDMIQTIMSDSLEKIHVIESEYGFPPEGKTNVV